MTEESEMNGDEQRVRRARKDLRNTRGSLDNVYVSITETDRTMNVYSLENNERQTTTTTPTMTTTTTTTSALFPLFSLFQTSSRKEARTAAAAAALSQHYEAILFHPCHSSFLFSSLLSFSTSSAEVQTCPRLSVSLFHYLQMEEHHNKTIYLQHYTHHYSVFLCLTRHKAIESRVFFSRLHFEWRSSIHSNLRPMIVFSWNDGNHSRLRITVADNPCRH